MGVKIIANHKISPEIIDLISEARKQVDLVTPFVQPWGHLQSEISAACERGVIVNLYFRKELREKYTETLNEFRRMGVEIHAVDHLHAKVYRSESMGIVSSMNLYQYSTENSEEIALVSTDRDFLRELDDFMEKLNNKASNITMSLLGAKAAQKVGGAFKSVVGMVGKAIANKLEGPAFCIRCKAEVKYDPTKPLCAKCLKSWSKYGDKNYVEKYCHSCGTANKGSVGRPVCLRCYKKSTA